MLCWPGGPHQAMIFKGKFSTTIQSTTSVSCRLSISCIKDITSRHIISHHITSSFYSFLRVSTAFSTTLSAPLPTASRISAADQLHFPGGCPHAARSSWAWNPTCVAFLPTISISALSWVVISKEMLLCWGDPMKSESGIT